MKNNNNPAHIDTPRGNRNDKRCENSSIRTPPKTGPKNPEIDTPMANQEKTTKRFPGALNSPRYCCIDRMENVKPVPTRHAETSSGARSAVS